MYHRKKSIRFSPLTNSHVYILLTTKILDQLLTLELATSHRGYVCPSFGGFTSTHWLTLFLAVLLLGWKLYGLQYGADCLWDSSNKVLEKSVRD